MFNKIFIQLLQNNNITAYKFSKETGIPESLISNWKNGFKTPSYDNILKIADYFNVSTDYLLGRTDNFETQNKSDKTNTIEDSSDTPASVENFLNKLKNGSPRGAVVVFKDGKGKEIIDMENMTEEQFKKIDAILDNYRNKN